MKEPTPTRHGGADLDTPSGRRPKDVGPASACTYVDTYTNKWSGSYSEEGILWGNVPSASQKANPKEGGSMPRSEMYPGNGPPSSGGENFQKIKFARN